MKEGAPPTMSEEGNNVTSPRSREERLGGAGNFEDHTLEALFDPSTRRAEQDRKRYLSRPGSLTQDDSGNIRDGQGRFTNPGEHYNELRKKHEEETKGREITELSDSELIDYVMGTEYDLGSGDRNEEERSKGVITNPDFDQDRTTKESIIDDIFRRIDEAGEEKSPTTVELMRLLALADIVVKTSEAALPEDMRDDYNQRRNNAVQDLILKHAIDDAEKQAIKDAEKQAIKDTEPEAGEEEKDSDTDEIRALKISKSNEELGRYEEEIQRKLELRLNALQQRYQSKRLEVLEENLATKRNNDSTGAGATTEVDDAGEQPHPGYQPPADPNLLPVPIETDPKLPASIEGEDGVVQPPIVDWDALRNRISTERAMGLQESSLGFDSLDEARDYMEDYIRNVTPEIGEILGDMKFPDEVLKLLAQLGQQREKIALNSALREERMLFDNKDSADNLQELREGFAKNVDIFVAGIIEAAEGLGGDQEQAQRLFNIINLQEKVKLEQEIDYWNQVVRQQGGIDDLLKGAKWVQDHHGENAQVIVNNKAAVLDSVYEQEMPGIKGYVRRLSRRYRNSSRTTKIAMAVGGSVAALGLGVATGGVGAYVAAGAFVGRRVGSFFGSRIGQKGYDFVSGKIKGRGYDQIVEDATSSFMSGDTSVQSGLKSYLDGREEASKIKRDRRKVGAAVGALLGGGAGFAASSILDSVSGGPDIPYSLEDSGPEPFKEPVDDVEQFLSTREEPVVNTTTVESTTESNPEAAVESNDDILRIVRQQEGSDVLNITHQDGAYDIIPDQGNQFDSVYGNVRAVVEDYAQQNDIELTDIQQETIIRNLATKIDAQDIAGDDANRDYLYFGDDGSNFRLSDEFVGELFEESGIEIEPVVDVAEAENAVSQEQTETEAADQQQTQTPVGTTDSLNNTPSSIYEYLDNNALNGGNVNAIRQNASTLMQELDGVTEFQLSQMTDYNIDSALTQLVEDTGNQGVLVNLSRGNLVGIDNATRSLLAKIINDKF